MFNVETWKGVGTFHLDNWKDIATYTPLKPDSISHKEKKNGIFMRFEVSSETQLQKNPANFVLQRVKKELMASFAHLEN